MVSVELAFLLVSPTLTSVTNALMLLSRLYVHTRSQIGGSMDQDIRLTVLSFVWFSLSGALEIEAKLRGANELCMKLAPGTLFYKDPKLREESNLFYLKNR